MRKSTEAFTLVELLVAITLGFAVIAAAYAALSASVESSRRIDGFTEESSTLANLAGSMRRQIANAYYGESSELSPVFSVTPSSQGAAAPAGETPRDTMTLSFASRSTSADADPQYPYYTVTYSIADASTDSPGGLSRRVTPLWPRDVTEEPRDELIAPEIRGLGLACFDGSRWTNQWDAAASGLPRAVRIELYVDAGRFAKDPWRPDDTSLVPPGRLQVYHVAAWLPVIGNPAASAGQISITAPVPEGANASAP